VEATKALHVLTKPIRPTTEGEAGVFDRFDRIPGANHAALRAAHVVLIGAGGLGGEVGHGLVRKGIGRLSVVDFDQVELSNLARQQFYAGDVGQYKALALVRNLASQATGRTQLDGYAAAFQEVIKATPLAGTLAVCGVDNNATRLAVARYYLRLEVPVIFLAVDAAATRGYCYVQDGWPGQPCFLCMFPDAGEDRTVNGCSGASIEILKVVAGLALYAVDSLLMVRPRAWTYKDVYLDGGTDGGRVIRLRPGCPLCGGQR
jgi:molybdopterin-synthase adenylyltransferase